MAQETNQSAAPVQPQVKSQQAPAAKTPAKKEPPHFELNVEGIYYEGKTEHSYDVIVKIPVLGESKGDGHYLTAALSRKWDYPLVKAIQKKYNTKCDYIHTHCLVSRVYVGDNGHKVERVVVDKETGEVSFYNMGREALESYIKENQIPMNLDLYTTVDAIRKGLTLYKKDKEAFKAQQEAKAEEARIKAEMKDLI